MPRGSSHQILGRRPPLHPRKERLWRAIVMILGLFQHGCRPRLEPQIGAADWSRCFSDHVTSRPIRLSRDDKRFCFGAFFGLQDSPRVFLL